MLSFITFFPLLGMVILLLVPSKKISLIRWLSLFFTFIPFLAGIKLFLNFDRTIPQVQFVERIPWIPTFNIEYYMGVDGLSITMVLLTTLLSLICIGASFSIKNAIKGYFAMFLLLETAMLGVFLALDFFLFFIFWEAMLLPMYFLIGIWGGESRVYAAIKFFIYTLFGSVLMLLVLIGFYFYGGNTFDLIRLATIRPFSGQMIELFGLVLPVDKLFWVLLFIGFAIKIPLWPFHTWLPWAHVEAPTAVSVVLAGVLLKMGTYGILRFNYPILPEATIWAREAMIIFGIINIIYGALSAMAQRDLKKLVAYSSISHMGYVMVGMASFTIAGINGAVLQMFNHGCSTAMLFLLVGVIYDRVHHRWIIKPDGSKGFGGISKVVPIYTSIMAIAVFASLGLPGLSGFISEALVFIGTFSVPKFQPHVVVASLGIILGAAYLLWMFMRIFLGPLNETHSSLPDMNMREILCLLPLCFLVIFLGVYPMPVLELMGTTLAQLLTLFF